MLSNNQPFNRLLLAIPASLLISLALLILGAQPALAQGPIVKTVDAGGDGDAGEYNSVVLNSSGFPVIAYIDFDVGRGKLAVCTDASCTSPTITTFDENFFGNGVISLKLDSSDAPIIAHDGGLIACWDAICDYYEEYFTIRRNPSLVLTGSDLPVISYYDDTNGDLKLDVCADWDCSGVVTTTIVDGVGDVGSNNSLVLNSSGYPVISYYDATNDTAKLAVCQDVTCTSVTIRTLGPALSEEFYSFASSVAVNSGDFPVVAYMDDNEFLRLTSCSDATCVVSTTTVINPYVTDSISLKLDSSDVPIISYYEYGWLELAICNDAACASPSISTIDPYDLGGGISGGFQNSLVLTSGDIPMISYYDADGKDLKSAVCNNTACTAPTLSVIDQGEGAAGEDTSLVLNSSGFPVISYYDSSNSALKLAVCQDAICNSVISTTVDSAGVDNSLVLNSSGFPVISYRDGYPNYDLKLAVCQDAVCNSVASTTVDSAGDVGRYTSLALNSSGFPVISYRDGYPNYDLKLAVCQDATCASVITTTMDSGGNVGWYSSLALNSSGFPAISYYDGTNSDLKLAVCQDATCASVITTTVDSGGNVGGHSSLALNSSGFPVISYYDGTNGDLKLAVCQDAVCNSVISTTVDSTGSVGRYTSLALNSNGFPVISYYDNSNDALKLVTCHDTTCSKRGIAIADSAGDVGWYSSLVLNSSGSPIVSYYESNNADLKLAIGPFPITSGAVRVGEGTPASCTEAALNAKLPPTSGSIVFSCGSTPHTIPISVTKVITTATAIDGEGLITLAGSGAGSLFTNSGADFNLANISLTGGTGTDGGALKNENNGRLTLTNVTVANSQAANWGGAIFNDSGTVNIVDSVLMNNTANAGGAIFNEDTITVTRSSIYDNSANTHGGGILAFSGNLNVSQSSIYSNFAGWSGGGFYNTGNLTLTNTTISHNTADEGGGLVNSYRSARLVNTTVVSNTAADGGVVHNEGTVTLKNSLVAYNSGSDCTGAITSQGHNLSSDASCNLTAAGDQPNTDPLLPPLANNGGPTVGADNQPLLTHALPADSPAVDAADAAACPAVDQRGTARPQGPGCDIGAFEVVPAPVLYIRKTAPVTASSGSPINYVITVTNRGNQTATNLLITDVIPANASFISSDGTKVGNVLSWTLASLSPKASTLANFSVSAATSVVNNQYRVEASEVSATRNEAVVTIVPQFGVGTGVFNQAQRLGSPPLNSRAAAVGDLNKDGYPDVFVVNGSPDRPYLSNGSGRLNNNPDDIGDGDGQAIALADLDDDGDLDAFVGNAGGQNNQVWLNDGSGRFAATGAPTLGNADAQAVALDDFNGDGLLDAMLGTDSGEGNQIWLNDGEGGLVLTETLTLGDSQALALADFNGDKRPDAVSANAAGEDNQIWLNDGDGTFSTGSTLPGLENSQAVAVGDLNGDKRPDVVIGNGGGDANQVWLNQASGSFNSSPDFSLGNRDTRGLALGDVDLDGDLDLLTANGGDEPNEIWLNDGFGNFGDEPVRTFDSSDSNAIVMADFDLDGDLDIFVANGGGDEEQQNTVWRNQNAQQQITSGPTRLTFGDGLTLTVDIPTPLNQPTNFTYTPLLGPTPPLANNLHYANRAFDLDTDGDVAFDPPLTLTVYYPPDTEITTGTLRLYYRDTDQTPAVWEDVASTCTPAAIYRYTADFVEITICHLTEFGLFELNQAPHFPVSGSTGFTPTNGIVIANPRPTFDWPDAEDDTGGINYRFTITGSGAFTGLTSLAESDSLMLSQSSYTPVVNLPAAAYTWTVRAYDEAGLSSPAVAPQSFVIIVAANDEGLRVYLPLIVK